MIPEAVIKPRFKKLYDEGIKVSEQPLSRSIDDQDEWRYSLVESVSASTMITYDNWTVPEGQDLYLAAIRVSNNLTSNLQQARFFKKAASDGSYYLFDGGYFLYNAEYILPVAYKIPSGDSLSMTLYNYAGSTATFVVIFTGFTDILR